MRKSMRYAVLLVFAAVVSIGTAALVSESPAADASNCWQVDCNICCKSQGKTICTQRACP